MIANNYCPKIACYADIRFQLGKPSNNVVDIFFFLQIGSYTRRAMTVRSIYTLIAAPHVKS